MKTVFALACMLLVSNAFAANCITDARGQVVCANGEKAVAVNPNTGNVNTVTRGQNGVETVHGNNGSAAYNARTGNAAVESTNQNGVTTTRTSRGGESKTKNGKGVYEAPNGTKCVRTAHHKGCT